MNAAGTYICNWCRVQAWSETERAELADTPCPEAPPGEHDMRDLLDEAAE